MPQTEFEAWKDFHRAQPIDDLHRIHRPAALIVKAMAGKDVPMSQILEYLQPEEVPEGMTRADLNTMRALGFDPKNYKPIKKKAEG